MTKYLQQLESESIEIIREAVAEAEHPVMLYSIGKDSGVMLHLARKAFYPGKIPFPLLHIDTLWKFQDMYRFRERIQKEFSVELITYTNLDGVSAGINPIDSGSQVHTDVMKTQALRQALSKFGFDMVFGGARRDEEKSRAKERVFSFRNSNHVWDPKDQRPELWNIVNSKRRKGESLRVFPLSNWTELDVWHYTLVQDIPIVPLYLAAQRPVIHRDGMLIMVDDDRLRIEPHEVVSHEWVRFRSLGCYPLSGAIRSTATSLVDVLTELAMAQNSERQGRLIDHDAKSSMELKKREGYF